MDSPILGSAYVARSVNAAANRMVNLFPEILPEAGKSPAVLYRAPGLRTLATIGTGPIRGEWQVGSYGYVVSGTELYRVTNTFVATLVGTVSGTGPVSMADNGLQIFIACNGPSFIYTIATNLVTQITDEDFPGAVTVGYLDGYFVFTEPNSQRVWVTSLLDGTAVDGLDFASAEGSPDGLVSLIVDHREVWLFGTNSAEVWYNSGDADFPLTRLQGAFCEVGCIAPYSVAKMDNSVFWLGADARGRGIIYTAKGYQAQRISTHAVEWQIQQYGDLTDAVAYTYQQDGHSFYVLNFTNANTTWVYDAATQAWAERAGFVNGNFVRHRANCQMSFANEIVVGDYQSGKIYAFDQDVYLDDGLTQKWLRSWRALPTGQNNLKRQAHHSLQLDCETGTGLPDGYQVPIEGILETEVVFDDITTESGDDLYVSFLADAAAFGFVPQVMLRWSDDGGHTWSNYHTRALGKEGAYGFRAIWRRLGMTMKLRDRVYEVSGTDPVKIAILGAQLDVTPTDA